MWSFWCAVGALLSALSVGLGAFGAHALKEILSQSDLLIFETATRYLTHHSLGLIAISLLMSRLDSTFLKISAPILVLGMLVFSGSLYALIWTGHRWLGAVTPVGGIGLILAWLLVAIALFGAYFA